MLGAARSRPTWQVSYQRHRRAIFLVGRFEPRQWLGMDHRADRTNHCRPSWRSFCGTRAPRASLCPDGIPSCRIDRWRPDRHFAPDHRARKSSPYLTLLSPALAGQTGIKCETGTKCFASSFFRQSLPSRLVDQQPTRKLCLRP